MCCLFGLLDYENRLSCKQRQRILRTLSTACEVRGTDATGIAYFTDRRLYIQKAPRPAHEIRFRLNGQARYIMGHTRMTTQGDGAHNYNNHPFRGKAGHTAFALAHNGVLYNDRELQQSRHLPKTPIETDSYVAVQLLERERVLNFNSLRHMAEAVRGSFTFTVLDAENNLYIVKGNNPMCIYHFERLGFYLYASTQEILDAAVKQLGLTQTPYRLIRIASGDILRIDAGGNMQWGKFNDDALWFRNCYDWDWGGYSFLDVKSSPEPEYQELLEEYAQITGVDRDTIQLLVDAGYDWMSIEELLYCPELLAECLDEIYCR